MHRVSALLLLLAQACASPSCGDDVAERLAAASQGDVVEVGACSVEGPLRVPPGVRLIGSGPASVVAQTARGGVAIELSAGASVEGVTVRSEGCAAIVARAGEVAIRDVHVRATTGLGIAVQGAARLVIENTDVEGALADGRVDVAVPSAPYACDAGGPATHGVVAIDVAAVAITETNVRGFAPLGALFVRSPLVWTGGAITDQLGTGLAVIGADAALDGIEMCRSRQGFSPIEAYGAVFAGGAQVESRGLTVCESDGIGLMHVDASGTHEALRATGNLFAAVWAQAAPALTVRDAVLEGNGFAGIAGLDVARLEVSGSRVSGTVLRTNVMGLETVRAADALHAIRSGSLQLTNLDLVGNQRIGLLVELGGRTSDIVSVDAVRIASEGDQLGAIAQGGEVRANWDAAIVRAGSAALNDARVTAPLEFTGAVGPSCLPDTASVENLGLAGFALAP